MSRSDHENHTPSTSTWRKRATALIAAIAVAVGGPLAVGVPASAAGTGIIEGTVRTTSGSPLAGIDVYATSDEGEETAYAVTDASGNYRLNAVGTFILEFSAQDTGKNYVTQWWQGAQTRDDATPVTVAAGGRQSGKNAALAVGATVSGTVKGAGDPQKNLEDVSVLLSSTDPASSNHYWAYTDVNGAFEFMGVAADTYTIEYDATSSSLNYVNQYWGTSDSGEPQTFTVAAASTNVGKDVVLAKGGSISGKVTTATTPAAVIPDVWVYAYSAFGLSEGTALTDDNGNYRIIGLAPGEHFLQFSNLRDEGATSYVAEWWNDSATESGATTVAVVGGTDASGRNASLTAGATITGIVTDTAGKALEDITVPIWEKQGEDWVLIDFVYTAEGGKYWISGLAVGSYKVGFAEEVDENDDLIGTLYQPQFYPAQPSLDEADAIAMTTAGQTTTNGTVRLGKKGAALPPVVDRFAGVDRYSTAVTISKRSFSAGVPVLYVATGLSFPDALAAAPAAAAQNGPLLLTAVNTLPASVKTEITRLKPEKIVVVGGTGAVSASVYNQLALLTPEIRRDAGADRFATSRMIVERAFPEGADTAFVATAWGFPDALAASAAAGAVGAPVILVDGKAASVDARTNGLLDTLGVQTAMVAGGTGVVSTQVEASLRTILGHENVIRFGGADRYTTAGIINRTSFTQSDTVYLANGLGFADALAGAALAGKNKAPLYTVYANCVPSFVLADITSLKASTVVLLGGAGVLTTSVAKLTPCK